MLTQYFRFLTAAALLGLAFCAHADSLEESRSFIEEQEARQQLVRQLKAPVSIGSNVQSIDQNWIEQMAQKQQPGTLEQSPEKEKPEVIYFVSSSIPAEGMHSILRDADRLGIPAVMRGLIGNDFRRTASYIMDLAQPENTGGVQIDPTLFKQYGITVVPALVVVCGTNYDRIFGNVKLDRALEIIAEDGDCKDVAARYLADRS